MTEPDDPRPDDQSPTQQKPPRKRRFRRRFLLWTGLPLAAAGLLAARAFADGGGCFHHRGPKSADELAARMRHGLDHVLSRVDADDAQRAEVDRIVDRAAPALFDARARGRQLRRDMLQAMRDDDRARVEQLRKQGLTLFDETTALGLKTAYEVGDVLDDSQREEVLRHLDRFIGRHHD